MDLQRHEFTALNDASHDPSERFFNAYLCITLIVMTPRELLTEWHQKASLNFSSQFLHHPMIDQERLDFIRDILLTSFDAPYFQLFPGKEISNDQINWIKSLLMAPDRFSAVKALQELSLQLQYCKRFPTLWKEFKRLRNNPINLRSFFFELFVYKTLDDAHIVTIKKPKRGKQELEGYCALKGSEFLFECKLPYLPGLEELFLVQRLMNDFYQQGTQKLPPNGYIATVELQRPLTATHRSELGEKIAKFYANLPSGVPVEINYHDPGPAGRLDVQTFSQERLDAVKEENKADVTYYLAPTGEVRENGQVMLAGKVLGKFNVWREKQYQKLESILIAEEEQHPAVVFPRKVLFIGSESFPEFQFGIFQHDNMFDRDRIVQLCNALELSCIVCFIRKYYQGNDPYMKVDVIASSEQWDEGLLIKHVFESVAV
jgi:hypothetical protein